MAKILSALETLPLIEGLKRSRGRWRILAFVALAGLLIVSTVRITGTSGNEARDTIARVAIDGAIMTNRSRLLALQKIEQNDAIKGVIVAINSPGGTTAGGEELYEAISRIAQDKPVAIVIDEMGASAAYMTAIAGDHIFARRLSIVGSIGVLVQHVNAAGLLEKIGIDYDKVQSGPLKAEPDVNDPLEGPARENMQQLVDDSFDWFVDIVAQERGLERAETLELSDGRVMTGQTALEVGLIDAIGGEREAREWIEGELEWNGTLPIVTHFPLPQNDFEKWMSLLGAQARQSIGLDQGSIVPLDGLVSLWHPTN